MFRQTGGKKQINLFGELKMERQKCKRLTFKSNELDISPTILLGVVVREDVNFLVFKTDKREYTISMRLVLCLEDTDVLFRGGFR